MGTAPRFTTLEAEAAARTASGRPYHEFLQVPDLSAGLYRLEAGAEDPQSPHAEDEIYVVVRGRGRFRAGPADAEVGPGSVLFVPALMEHRFHTIEETLELLVIFGPAEGTRR
jgi:mannose-6-phosphate isomerase-like protein (cupin superfamily)